MEKSEEYLGIHMEPLVTDKERKKRARNPIFLYDPEVHTTKSDIGKLNQILNVYKHNIYDFEFNAKKIIKHYRKHYGNTAIGMFTLGQSISFRVYEGQKPIQLPLYKFLMNYTMIIPLIILGADMRDWEPWMPAKWTNGAWRGQMNRYIKTCRTLGNMRAICECLSMSKYLMNIWAAEAGDRLAMSISNNEFYEVAMRSKDAYESMTCTFPIPKDITPNELEDLATKRTTDLINTISKQSDLCISTYTENGLFNPAQFREFAVHIGYKPDLKGNTIPYTHNTNIIMGTADPRAHMVDACGGRKAEVLKLNVSNAGALERSLSMMMSQVRFVDTEWECDSKHFRKRYINSVDILEKLDGRVCTLDPESDEYLIIDPDDNDLIGRTVYLKTPITCTHPDRHKGYICSACYGKLMSSLNCDVHIGRLVALQSADDIEQKLLSAKHALNTNTHTIIFDDEFDSYFDLGACQIYFNQSMIDASTETGNDFNHLHFEFHPKIMGKHQDGESRHYDRSIPEIVIYNSLNDSRTIIRELNGIMLYLSPEFVDNYYLDAAQYKEKGDVVLVPFSSIIQNGKVCCDILFEYQYKNNELAAALMELEDILTKGSSINSFTNYDECLDKLIPLFVKGGIHLPEFQTEMLISKMIYGMDGSSVNWNEAEPEYKFFSIDKSIQHCDSALTSIMYRYSIDQIAGAYGTYEKTGTSAYDWFIMERT